MRAAASVVVAVALAYLLAITVIVATYDGPPLESELDRLGELHARLETAP